jgi:hypothetical protein
VRIQPTRCAVMRSGRLRQRLTPVRIETDLRTKSSWPGAPGNGGTCRGTCWKRCPGHAGFPDLRPPRDYIRSTGPQFRDRYPRDRDHPGQLAARTAQRPGLPVDGPPPAADVSHEAMPHGASPRAGERKD